MRDLAAALAICAGGALGAFPGSRSGPDPVALVLWLSSAAAAAGFVAGSIRAGRWFLAALPPAAWAGLLAVVDGLSPRDLPTPALAALAWTGLYAAGFGLGRLAPARGLSGASILLLGALALAALPIAPGFLGAPLPPDVAARLLDLSPATLVAECAGIDWMRHPLLYAPAGTADIEPALRAAFDGALAGPIAFVVGCSVALGGIGISRARATTPTPSRTA